MKASKRNTKRVLEQDKLIELYDELLVFCENEETDFGEYDLSKNNFLSEIETKLGFKLEDDITQIDKKAIDTFYFTLSKKVKIKSWFFHLRNTIAHNRIFTVDNENTLILEDSQPISEERIRNGEIPELSMYAKVSSFEKLKQIIICIKNKKYETT